MLFTIYSSSSRNVIVSVLRIFPFSGILKLEFYLISLDYRFISSVLLTTTVSLSIVLLSYNINI